jgi:hypothetical protein
MSESILNEIKTVNHKQAAALILANPNVRYMLRGEPGVGKSMIAEAIAEATGYDLSMVDVPNLDLGDVAMPVIDHSEKVTRYYPNARFGLTTGKPVVICLDEFTKGADPVKNMLHPMLEVFRPRLGDLAIPEGSIIFMTGNMDTDGVGDGLAQHTRQRVVELVMRKPNATEWLQWAAANGIHPVVMAWVDRYPQALASYLDGANNELHLSPCQPAGQCGLASHTRDCKPYHLADGLLRFGFAYGFSNRGSRCALCREPSVIHSVPREPAFRELYCYFA